MMSGWLRTLLKKVARLTDHSLVASLLAFLAGSAISWSWFKEDTRVPRWAIVLTLGALAGLLPFPFFLKTARREKRVAQQELQSERRRRENLEGRCEKIEKQYGLLPIPDEYLVWGGLLWVLTHRFLRDPTFPPDSIPELEMKHYVRGPLCSACKRDAARELFHGIPCPCGHDFQLPAQVQHQLAVARQEDVNRHPFLQGPSDCFYELRLLVYKDAQAEARRRDPKLQNAIAS